MMKSKQYEQVVIVIRNIMSNERIMIDTSLLLSF